MARDTEPRSGGGLKIWARFTLFMTLALTLVMVGAGFFLYNTSSQVADRAQERALLDTIALTAESARIDAESARLMSEREMYSGLIRELDTDAPETMAALRERLLDKTRRVVAKQDSLEPFWRQIGRTAKDHKGTFTTSTAIAYGPDGNTGTLFQYKDPRFPEAVPFRLLLPDTGQRASSGLLGLIIGTTILVILVGAGVSVLVANQVSQPLEAIVEDVRHISSGDLNHRTRSKGASEITTLARSIDKMTSNLRQAQETELELSIREREVEVAGEVREALLPKSTPVVAGYELGAAHLQSRELGGDFHDFIELPDDPRGRVGLLVCDVSGKGLPGALVGATARSYLRAELRRGADVKDSFHFLNRQLVQDVRRGMYVTALYLLLDPAEGIATVACAGHKIPLVRYTAADGKVRLIQPEGIALGFDQGPVFERSLDVQQVPLEPGDRLVLANTATVGLTNAAGVELGEKPFYKQVMALGGQPTDVFLSRIKAALAKYAGAAALPSDVAIVTVRRQP
jgi:serine phosphatase RsbU (regulator of sigma subunit)